MSTFSTYYRCCCLCCHAISWSISVSNIYVSFTAVSSRRHFDFSLLINANASAGETATAWTIFRSCLRALVVSNMYLNFKHIGKRKSLILWWDGEYRGWEVRDMSEIVRAANHHMWFVGICLLWFLSEVLSLQQLIGSVIVTNSRTHNDIHKLRHAFLSFIGT